MDVRYTDKSRHFSIAEFFALERLQEEARRSFILRMSGKLFAAKHSWTTLRMSRPLFVGSFCRSRGGLLANEKEEKFVSNDNANYFVIFEEGNCVFLSDYL